MRAGEIIAEPLVVNLQERGHEVRERGNVFAVELEPAAAGNFPWFVVECASAWQSPERWRCTHR